MNRNSLRSQFFSTLNPDSIYQILFHSQNHNHVEQNVENQKKSEKKCPQKHKYLTIVSKPKKPLNRSVLKSQKKILNKRSQSVILGGQKTTASRTRIKDKSIKSSLCNSCICLHQNNQITPHSQPLPQKSLIQKDNLQNSTKTPANYASLHHINNQVTKIVSHKLNMGLVQPHQSIVKQIIFKTPVKQESKGFDRKFTRNFSTTGKIYFSYGKSLEVKQTNQDKKFFSTPKFQRAHELTQRKSRRNAGFIRSASVKKISPEKSNVDKDEVQRKRSMSNFSLSQYCSEGAQNTETKPKRLEVDLCLEKMSAIRKEIDQLQGMLHDRLETAELRNKLMYYPQQIIERKVNVLRFQQIQNKRKYYPQERPSHQLTQKASQMSSNNSFLCQSKTQTLVNNLTRLDNTKPNSIVGGLSQSSLSSFSSGSIQMSNQNNARKQPLGVHKTDNILSNKFQNMQCPSAQQIQKRVISQILFNKRDNPSHQNYYPSQNLGNQKRAFKHQNGNPCGSTSFGGITGTIIAEKGLVNRRPNFMMTNFIR